MLSAATVDLIACFARENRAWGYGKHQGELLKVGRRVSRAAIKRGDCVGMDYRPRRRHTS
jgi:hypothetical protein